MNADSVVKDSLTTAADGKRYKSSLYNLDLILAIGYRVRSPRGVQFRQWATTHLLARIRKKETQLFFAEVQNKLLYAATRKTAAELIVAKNYLSEDEVDILNRLVIIFLEQAELRARKQQDLTLDYWQSSVDRMLASNDHTNHCPTMMREENSQK